MPLISAIKLNHIYPKLVTKPCRWTPLSLVMLTPFDALTSTLCDHRRLQYTSMPHASLFRSEDVTAVQIFIPSEVAKGTVSALG